MIRRGPYQFIDVVSDSLLLVEGQDDARFFNAFLRQLSIPGVQIAAVDGKDNFAPFLKNILVTAPGYPRLRSLALIRDADNNSSGAFRSLRSALVNAGLPAPFETFKTWSAGRLSVSIAILPDGVSPGNLEDLCLRSIGDLLALECVDQYLACRNPDNRLDGILSKARLHSYLAVSDVPGRRLGEAADASVWDWNSSALQPLAEFLRRL